MPKSRVSIARKENIAATLRQAVEGLGGLPPLNNLRVLIKPNVNSHDPCPGTSNPETVRELVKLVQEQEPEEIVVADASNHSYLPTVETMKKTGLYEAIADLGVTIIGLEDYEWVSIQPERAKSWKQFSVSRLLHEFGYFINQCNIKTHFLARYSGALKNMAGLIDYRSRMSMHLGLKRNFYRMIAELSLIRKPDFIVLDGTKAMVTGGPFKGDVKESGLILAAKDPVAIDAVGLAILKTLGTTPKVAGVRVWEQPTIKHAIKLGLGATSAADIELVSEGVEEIEEINNNLA